MALGKVGMFLQKGEDLGLAFGRGEIGRVALCPMGTFQLGFLQLSLQLLARQEVEAVHRDRCRTGLFFSMIGLLVSERLKVPNPSSSTL